jgi:hypothetical protein
MKKPTILKFSIIISLLASLIGIGSSSVIAQSNNGQALEIAPPVLILSADPGQTITAKITVRNISGSSLLVTGQINDFVAAGEDGTPKILMEDTNTESNPYSIINWISPMPQLNLISKQLETLPVTINVPADASPGGHYGVVRFTGVPPELEGTGVSLSASLGSLILVRVSGDIKDELSMSDFFISQNKKPGSFFEQAPLTISEKIKNTGNVHEQPSGLVTITDMFGKKLATLGVNATAPQGNVLPGSTRQFDQNLNNEAIGNKIMFGLYTANVSIKYGPDNKEFTKTISFWVIPYRIISAIVIAIVLVITGLVFGIKRYNKYIISQARKSKK